MNEKSGEQNLREAVELSDFMLEMRLQRLRATHPDLPEPALMKLLSAELASREMDGVGRVVAWRDRASRE